ncbi:MAG: N-6 DNA methylase [Candidatus Latescibacteria bacterium]|nr:N-6 DNA methylase [Candidatus Latescibacterota bacterium]
MTSAHSEQKSTGSHYTPPALAAFVAKEMLKLWQPPENTCDINIFDPALGDGELLLAVLKNLQEMDLHLSVSGYETNKSEMLAAKKRIKNQFPKVATEFHNRDFLAQSAGYFSQPDLFQRRRPEQFDLVISNPPYVRTQVMGAKKSQDIARQFGLAGRVDLYYAFIIAIAQYIHPEGILGIIVSNRFMTTRSGETVRARIKEMYEIEHIWDLGDTKLFEAAVLPAVLMLKPKTSGKPKRTAKFTSIYTSDPVKKARNCESPIEALRSSGYVKTKSNGYFRVLKGELDSGRRSEDIWRITTKESREWLNRVRRNTAATFKDLGKIRVGVKTTADRVFIRSDWDDMPLDKRPELLKDLTTHHIGNPYRSKTPESKILYPHTILEGKRCAVNLASYPKTKAYLEEHRNQLEGRKYVIEAGREWYEIWVPQDPKAWEKAKIVFRDIAKHPTFWLDIDGTVVNGDCYWISCSEEHELTYLALAVGNSSFIECFYDRSFNNKLYAGRRRFMTQYVEQFPLPRIDSAAATQLIKMSKQTFECTSDKKTKLMHTVDKLVWKAFGFHLS